MTQVPDPHTPSLVGTLIEGKYLLERELGSGGMGAVYLARHKTIEREVAIKLLHRALASDASIRRRFEIEARAIARLSHPNCVMLYEFGLEPELEALYAVFEYVRGRSLEKWAGQKLAIEDVLDVGRQVVAAIDHAHSQKIIHRDLKPDNIMVTVTDSGKLEVKVLDFGIARITEDGENEDESRLTKMGQMFGTPPYMSPEQIKAKLNVTFATDIYSIGVILYELIEGRLPFLADSPIETVMMHLNDEVPPMVRSDLPDELRQIVMRCLQKDAEARFGSCAELSAALDGVVVTGGEITALTDVGGVANLRDNDAPAMMGVSGEGLGGEATEPESPDSGPVVSPQNTALEFGHAPTLGASPDSWQGHTLDGVKASVSAGVPNALASAAGESGDAARQTTVPPTGSEAPSSDSDVSADSASSAMLASADVSASAEFSAPVAQQPGRAIQSTEDVRASPETWPEIATGTQRKTLVTLMVGIFLAVMVLLAVLYWKTSGADPAELNAEAEATLEGSPQPESAGTAVAGEDGARQGDVASSEASADEASQGTTRGGVNPDEPQPSDDVAAAEPVEEGRAQSPDSAEEEVGRGGAAEAEGAREAAEDRRERAAAETTTTRRPTTRKAPAPEPSAEEPEEPARLRLNRTRRISKDDEPESTEEPARLTLPGR